MGMRRWVKTTNEVRRREERYDHIIPPPLLYTFHISPIRDETLLTVPPMSSPVEASSVSNLLLE